MVDHDARKRLAEQLRHLATGLITNDQFEDLVYSVKTDDAGYWALVNQAWFLYSDLHTHKLQGSHALQEDDRKTLCRFILFLHSGLEYEWPRHPCTGLIRLLTGILSFGAIPKHFDVKWKSSGDFVVYPFFRRQDFEVANQHPKLLGGEGTV